uniref:inhibitor of growth protein 3-like n=1 Tax=Styela clava TaxID=7725 RepID=UPI001939620E|nr:inhibitor of growth protein 3-like [Styela clava]
MLYLEDYVELIEHLPVDVRDRFTDMREMDLQVQNTVDDLNGRVKSLFRACLAKKGKIDNADETFDDIRATYRKALDDADEKVQLANQIYDLVDRHLRKLDQELAKFKMELEADNGGITEILERRSLELDNHVSQTGHSSRKRLAHATTVASSSAAILPGTSNGPVDKKLRLDGAFDLLYSHSESAPPSVLSPDFSTITSGNDVERSNSRPPSRNSTTGTGQSIISALQTPVATEGQSVRHPGGLKTNNIGIKLSETTIKQEDFQQGLPPDFVDCKLPLSEDMMDEDSCHSTQDGLLMSPTGSRPSRTKKQTSRAAAWTQERMQAEARRGHAREKDHISPNSSMVELVGESSNASSDWTLDPNEPRYCICNQVSYGEMVGCDNSKCTVEWFHYGCVNLTEAPKGKWYCPQCTQTMKRRNKNKQ